MPAHASGFDRFWAKYPRRNGKLSTVTAWTKARKIATAEEIMAGLETYIQHLPSDTQFVPYPATWLNAGRWMDEYVMTLPKAGHWSDECQTLHGGSCLKRWDHEMRKREAS